MLVSGNCGTGCVGVTGTDAVPSVANVLFNSVYNCKEEKKNCANAVTMFGGQSIQRGGLALEGGGTQVQRHSFFFLLFLVSFSNCCALAFRHSFAL